MCRIYRPWAAVAVVLALVGAGCGGGDEKTPVSGVVKLDGQPVEGAMVTFVPAGAGKGQIASGMTDKEGVFRLTTTTPGDGAFPGDYKVTIVYAEAPEAPPAKGMKEAFTGFEKAQKQKLGPPRYKIPPKYRSPHQSPRTQKVPPEGEVLFEINSK